MKWIWLIFLSICSTFWIVTYAAPTTDTEKLWSKKSHSSGCFHNGNEYKEGEQIATKEPCLNCTCLRGALRCQLQVCPYLEDLYPPPPGCILVERKGACCPKLHCPDTSIENRLNRQDPSGQIAAWKMRNEVRKRIVKQLNKSASDKLGCVESGTLYADGSAMMTSTNCEYCFCLKGKQVCTKPKCTPPMDGCIPQFRALACCPTHYDCNNSTTIIAEKTITTGEGRVRPLVANSASGAMRENDRLIDSPLPGPQQTRIRKSQKKFDSKFHSLQKRDSESANQTKAIKQDQVKKEAESLFDTIPNTTESIAEEKSEMSTDKILIDVKDMNEDEDKLQETLSKSNSQEKVNDSEKKEEIKDKSPSQENNEKSIEQVDKNPETIKETAPLPDTMEVKVSTSVTSLSDSQMDGVHHRQMDQETDSLTSEARESHLSSGHSAADQASDTSTSRSETISSAQETISSVSVNVSVKESNEDDQRDHDEKKKPIPIDQTSTKFSQPALLPGGLVPLGMKDEASSSPNEYEDFDYQNMELPPSLPNLEIIPFVAADAVVGNPVLQLDDDERLNPVTTAEQRTPISHVAPSVTQSGTSEGNVEDRLDTIDTLPEATPIELSAAGIHVKQDTGKESLSNSVHSTTTLSPLLAFSVTFPSRPTSTLPSSPSSFFLRTTTLRPSTVKSKFNKPSVNNLVGSSAALPTGPLKVEGCNIYGQMYRVGRIIEELSGPCIECKCTEVGVGCAPLKC